MIKLTEDQLIITFNHPCPCDVVRDIQDAIITNLQHFTYNDTMNVNQIQHSNYFLLELLKQTLDVEEVTEQKK
jgi:hypothetical protein